MGHLASGRPFRHIGTRSVFAFALYRHRARNVAHEARQVREPDNSSAPSTSPRFRAARVTDGDTLVAVGADGVPLTVRLLGVDAPESDQPDGLEAKEYLLGWLNEKEFELRNVSKGKYGRYVADVFVQNDWINLQLVANGHAWFDPAYSSDRRLLDAQEEAKRQRVGLWRDGDATPPWIWRAQRK